jgi:hypothetical protein
MTESESGSRPRAPCPDCGGRLTDPISGDVHCYVECTACGRRFDLKDPRIDVG